MRKEGPPPSPPPAGAPPQTNAPPQAGAPPPAGDDATTRYRPIDEDDDLGNGPERH
jgi:hypothetical protein